MKVTVVVRIIYYINLVKLRDRHVRIVVNAVIATGIASARRLRRRRIRTSAHMRRGE
jgi:hypothetical protein